MKQISLLVAAALTVASLVAAPLTASVSAQEIGAFDSYGYDSIGTNVLANSMMDKHLMDKVIARQPQPGGGGKQSKTGKSKVQTKKSAGSTVFRGTTRFRTDRAARKKMLAGLVTQARASNPKAADALQRDFAKGDPIVAVAPALARLGLRTDDVADTMAAYLVGAWYGVRGSTQDPPRSYLNATRAQMRRALLSSPAFVSSSNASKQRMSDAFLLQLMVGEQTLTSARGNATKMASAKSRIRQGALQSFNLDMTKVKLTNAGLRS